MPNLDTLAIPSGFKFMKNPAYQVMCHILGVAYQTSRGARKRHYTVNEYQPVPYWLWNWDSAICKTS